MTKHDMHPDGTPMTDRHMNEDELLTAFALGALEGDAADDVAERVACDAAAADEVATLRALGDALAVALADEPAPRLTAAQRAAIAQGGRADEPAPIVYSFRSVFGTLGLAAAACIVIALVVMQGQEQGPVRSTAMNAPSLAEKSANGRRQDLARDRADASRPISAQVPTVTAQAEALYLEVAPTVDVLARSARSAASELSEHEILAIRSPDTATWTRGSRRFETGASAGDGFGGGAGVGGGGGSAPAAAGVRLSGTAPGAAGGPGAAGREGGEVMRGQAGRRAPALEQSGAAFAAQPAPLPPGPPATADAPSVDADRVAAAPAREETRKLGQPGAPGAGAGGLPAETPADTGVAADITLGAGLEIDEDDALDFDPLERQQQVDELASREAYALITDNPFADPMSAPLSTFSVDVDTASYSNVRSLLQSGIVPSPDAVRIEEMINYFDYDYPAAGGVHPFSVTVDGTAAPWNPEHRLVRVGLRGVEVDPGMRPATSLVFLVDVSGSMRAANKLPLVQASLRLLVESLTPDDRIAIVTYAGSSGVLLESTYCHERERIAAAIDGLRPGGSTNGGAGIVLAYEQARGAFIEGGVNRVILCTDGDFNVGVSSDGDLVRLIERERESDVFLSVLGYGRGNYQDTKMEELSNRGNGNAAYIDSLAEAKRVLVERMAGTLVTIAKDVKVQVEFNPARVGAYRLIGYANRMLAAEDFNDDRVDAGEIGAGHTVTALYEIAPRGSEPELLAGRDVDDLRYKRAAEAVEPSEELLAVKLRYKAPEGDESTLIETPFTDAGAGLEAADDDLRFAASVAGFGMLLRQSPYRGGITWEDLLGLLRQIDTSDEDRAEMVRLVETAQALMGGG